MDVRPAAAFSIACHMRPPSTPSTEPATKVGSPIHVTLETASRTSVSVAVRRSESNDRTVSDDLGDYRARIDPASDALVFCTTTGHRLGATNIRRRVLDKAVKHANAQLVTDGCEPLPDGLTPHSLRRTFASLLFGIGETPPYVMAQMGHTTPNLTLAIYARQMDRRDGEPERLKALVDGSEWTRGVNDATVRRRVAVSDNPTIERSHPPI